MNGACLSAVENEEESDLKYEIARSNYGGMLHDGDRNEKYMAAIESALLRMKKKDIETFVLDIGTGTGLLAMMAAKAGATKVIGCESFEPMAEVAKKIVRRNGLDKTVEIIHKCSFDLDTEYTSLSKKPSLLVTEIFDTELLGEGVLPTLRHAHHKLLAPGCQTVPSGAEALVVLISSASLWRSHKMEEKNLLRYRNELNCNETLEILKKCKGTASPYEVHIDKVDDVISLSSPESIAQFDFSVCYEHTGRTSGESVVSQVERTIDIIKNGTIHGVLFWWKLIMDAEGKIVLEMNPKSHSEEEDLISWRDHWMQAVYFVPEPVTVSKGDRIQTSCCFDDYSIWFDVRKVVSLGGLTDKSVDRPMCDCGLHVVWSRERFQMQNSDSCRRGYVKAVKKMPEPLGACLCIGELSLLPHWLLEAGYSEVIYIDCSTAIGVSSNKTLERIIGTSRIKIINSAGLPSTEQLNSFCRTYQTNVFFLDPMFSSNLLPWHSLSIWKSLWSWKENCSSLATVAPDKILLKGVAVEFGHLWKARAPVKSVQGFDMSDYDDLIQGALVHSNPNCGLFREADPFPLWEYDFRCLSDCFTLMEFDVNFPISENKVHESSFRFNSSGRCDAVALWIEYCFCGELVLTTGLEVSTSGDKQWVKHSQQGVYFFSHQHQAQIGCEQQFSVHFNYENSEVFFRF